MERRNTVTDTLFFRVGKNVRYNTYKVDLKWKDILETEGPLPTDTYGGIHFQDEKQWGFGSMSTEDEAETFEVAKMKVYRERSENDTEYFARMKRNAEQEKSNLEKERLEYLRLKAKFENGIVE